MSQVANEVQGQFLKWVPTYIRSWEEWLDAWNSAQLAEIRHSLLYFGFKLPEHDGWQARLIFYLELADGHDESRFSQTGDGQGHFYGQETTLGRIESYGDMRRLIAQKAFGVLCREFFKREPFPQWDPVLPENFRVFAKLLWFFRPTQYGSISNVPHAGGPVRDAATKYAMNMCTYLLGFPQWQGGRAGSDDIVLRMLRPEIVRVLFGLRRLDILLRLDDYRPDLPVLWTLKELAMNQKLHLPGEGFGYCTTLRLPTTLEEAVAGGSKPAEVLTLLWIKLKERKRLRLLVEAKQVLRDDENKVKKLSRTA